MVEKKAALRKSYRFMHEKGFFCRGTLFQTSHMYKGKYSSYFQLFLFLFLLLYQITEKKKRLFCGYAVHVLYFLNFSCTTIFVFSSSLCRGKDFHAATFLFHKYVSEKLMKRDDGNNERERMRLSFVFSSVQRRVERNFLASYTVIIIIFA